MSVTSARFTDALQSALYWVRSYNPQLPFNRKGKLSIWQHKSACSIVAKPFDDFPKRGFLLFKVYATPAETEQPKWWEKNAGPNMIDIHSSEEFFDALSQARDKLVIVEFYGTWCASCRALFPKLCRTAVEHPEIIFLKVNFDENKTLCKSLNVKVLPFFHFYKGADGLVESFSCSLAKLQKLKDAIALHSGTDQVESSSNDNGTASYDLPQVTRASEEKSL